VDYDVSVTTTTLVRDSTLDSVQSSSCCAQPPDLLLVDPTPDARCSRVQVVSAAVDVEHSNNFTCGSDRPRDARDVAVSDVTPEAEVVVDQARSSACAVSVMNGGARQYLYDDIAGHYSPAGRGYPHGFHHPQHTSPVTLPLRHRPPVVARLAAHCAHDDDDDVDDVIPQHDDVILDL